MLTHKRSDAKLLGWRKRGSSSIFVCHRSSCLTFIRILQMFFSSRYLKEQIKQLKEEKNMAVSALARYKVRLHH